MQILWNGISTKTVFGIWQALGNYGMLNHLKGVCESITRQGRETVQEKKPIHEM